MARQTGPDVFPNGVVGRRNSAQQRYHSVGVSGLPQSAMGIPTQTSKHLAMVPTHGDARQMPSPRHSRSQYIAPTHRVSVRTRRRLARAAARKLSPRACDKAARACAAKRSQQPGGEAVKRAWRRPGESAAARREARGGAVRGARCGRGRGAALLLLGRHGNRGDVEVAPVATV